MRLGVIKKQMDENQPDWARLATAIERQNELLERALRDERNWKKRMLFGALTGFGSVIGATLVVSALVYLIKPFGNVEYFKPTVDHILRDVQGKRLR